MHDWCAVTQTSSIHFFSHSHNDGRTSSFSLPLFKVLNDFVCSALELAGAIYWIQLLVVPASLKLSRWTGFRSHFVAVPWTKATPPITTIITTNDEGNIRKPPWFESATVVFGLTLFVRVSPFSYGFLTPKPLCLVHVLHHPSFLALWSKVFVDSLLSLACYY